MSRIDIGTLSSLIALIRALDSHSSVDTDIKNIVIRALSGESSCSELKGQKLALAPGCTSCKTPCGRTEEPDITYLASLPNWEMKMKLLDRITEVATSRLDDNKLELIYKAIFNIGESWVSEETISELLNSFER
ncbi:MAG: hypothetical protein K6G51_07990 [Sphaerochaetaceae bacterium]|nr:hypothetical protein [Sphaerochaetaceae bacterium]